MTEVRRKTFKTKVETADRDHAAVAAEWRSMMEAALAPATKSVKAKPRPPIQIKSFEA